MHRDCHHLGPYDLSRVGSGATRLDSFVTELPRLQPIRDKAGINVINVDDHSVMPWTISDVGYMCTGLLPSGRHGQPWLSWPFLMKVVVGPNVGTLPSLSPVR